MFRQIMNGNTIKQQNHIFYYTSFPNFTDLRLPDLKCSTAFFVLSEILTLTRCFFIHSPPTQAHSLKDLPTLRKLTGNMVTKILYNKNGKKELILSRT